MTTDRELILSVTRKDFTETHIRGSGNGGQHRQKVHTGVRLVHKASGAVGESTQYKSQHQNRQAAWAHLRETPEWKVWLRTTLARLQGQPTVAERLEEAMKEQNIRTQIHDDHGRWVDANPEALT